jgi:hypothetical protein
MDQPSRVIAMKVGLHLGEPYDAIVEGKLAEERATSVASREPVRRGRSPA